MIAMKKHIFSLMTGAVLLGGICMGQESAQNDSPFKVTRRQNGIVVDVGEYEIRNTFLMHSAKIGKNAMFRSFMHGVHDGEAEPVAWESLGSDLPLEQGGFNTPVKSSALASILLNGGESVTFEKPVLNGDKLLELAGKHLRFFVWISAKNTGQGSDLWSGAPSLKVEIVDFDGEVLSVTPSYFRTRGTFPWFCYYMDVEIPKLNKVQAAAAPENAEAKEEEGTINWDALLQTGGDSSAEVKRAGGLYLTLANPVSGEARFSTLSWKTVHDMELLGSHQGLLSRIDPVTNSTAPNPDYDELPMHLMFGLSKQGTWNFLKGNKAWSGIVSSSSLKEYLDGVSGDWMHMIHAVPQLASLHSNGMLLKNMTEFDEEWIPTLKRYLQDMQDSATGMWTVSGKPSLFATYAIVFNAFHPRDIVHPGYAPNPTPWLTVDGSELQYANQMIESIIAQQRRFGAKNIVAGWNNYAFMENMDNVPDAAMPCTLEATAAAARLLAFAAERTDNEQLKAKARDAIRDAWQFVMGNLFMTTTPRWKVTSADKMPTVPGAMYDFIEATQWLDIRQNNDLRVLPPATTLDIDGRLTLKWDRDKKYVSLRVFAAPADKPTAELTEENLVAIIQPKTAKLTECDPFNAIRAIIAEAESYWRFTPENSGAHYLSAKLAKLPKGNVNHFNIKEVKLKIPQKAWNQTVHIAAVTPYGEMTQFITLPETIAALEQTGEEGGDLLNQN